MAEATASSEEPPDSWGAIASGGGGGGAWSAPARLLLEASARALLEEGGSGLSGGMKVLYILASIALVVISGLMAGLVLGLLSLDRMDLEVLRRTGSDRQKWLVARVEPFTRDPHFVMCSLVVVNAACNTALPLFIDRLLNPLAALLISITAILLFSEIAPQAVCKRYGLEIGAYCSWLVRAIMVLTAPVSWPLGKALDALLGEESVLFRRQELNALISLHAEPQHDGSVGALTSDEATVIKGALDLASKTAEAVMTPLNKVFMLRTDAVIDAQLLSLVLAAGHSRVPVHEGENKQAILGLVLVKELLLVDEQAGVRVRDLRLHEAPFLRADVPLYDVLKIFRFGRKHMACLTRVAPADASTGGGRRVSPTPGQGGLAAGFEGELVEEVVGVVTIEDVLEELLQAEIVDETDRFEDNLQTVQAAQVSMKELPPNLRRFLSPRRSLYKDAAARRAAELEVRRLSPAGATSSGRSSPEDDWQREPLQGGAQPPPGLQRQHSASSARSLSQASLGAAGAASALVSLGGAGGAEAMAAAMAAGVRAAELAAAHGGHGQGQGPAPAPRPSRLSGQAANGGSAGAHHARRASVDAPGRPPLPPRQVAAGHHAAEAPPDLEMGQLGSGPQRKATSSDEGEGGGEEDHRWPLVRRSGRQSSAPS